MSLSGTRGQTSTYPNVIGISSTPTFVAVSNASATDLYSYYGRSDNYSASSVIHSSYNYYAATPTITPSGSIMNAYGFYAGNITGAKTTNYAIYTNRGLVRFGDAVTIDSGSAVGGFTITSGSMIITSGGLTITSGSMTLTRGNLILTAGSLTLTSGSILLASGGNIVTDTTLGTKIGSAAAQKLGFWGVTTVIQPAISTTACSVITSPTGGSSINSYQEFDGWTVPKVIKALRNAGILA